MTAILDPSVESEVRNHCWNYFALHAQQRMSAFQFFITLETALMGAVLLILQAKTQFADSYWTVLIGPMITVLAFVFWKIDQRTRDLIKAAEESLKEIEKFFSQSTTIATKFPFLSDEQTKGYLSTFPLLQGRLTYSKSFGVVFFVCAFFGVVFTFALAANR